jgi:hypothetical protein
MGEQMTVRRHRIAHVNLLRHATLHLVVDMMDRYGRLLQLSAHCAFEPGKIWPMQ